MSRDTQGRFKAGQSGNPKGRPKGSKNKSVILAENVFKAFKKVGGWKWLVEWINKSDANARAFLQALSRLLPKDITISPEGNRTFKITFGGENDNTDTEEPDRD